MSTYLMLAGSSETFDLSLIGSAAGEVSSSSGIASENGNPRVIRFAPNAASQAYVSTWPFPNVDLGNTGRLSVWVYYEQLPAGGGGYCDLFGVSTSGSGGKEFVVAVTNAAVPRFHLYGEAGQGISISGDGSAVPSGRWFRVCLCWNITSTSVYTIKLFIDGVLDLSATNAGSLFSSAYSSIRIGDQVRAASPRWIYNVSGLYVDQDGSLNDIGDVHVTAKLPAKLNTNNFDTLGGSASNRWDYVDERPLSLTNYIQHAAISNVQENFGIEGELEGDANLCGAQIIARSAWVVAVRGDLGTSVYTYVTANSKTAGTTLAFGFTSLVPLVGMTVLMAFAMDGATGTVSCTDNASTPNTYVVDVDKAAASPSTSNVRLCIIRGYIANATNLTTVTITHPSVTARAVCGAVFAGILQSSPLDKTVSAVGTAANPATGATGTTSQGYEVIFAACAYEGPDSSLSGGLGSSLRISTSSATSGGGAASNVEARGNYLFQTGAAAQSSTWTASSGDWAAGIATYKSLGTGVGDPKLMNNGTETSVVLTTANAPYMNIIDAAEYPNNPAAVGMRSANDAPSTVLRECGMAIAYIPGPPTHHHHKWGPTFNPVLAQ